MVVVAAVVVAAIAIKVVVFRRIWGRRRLSRPIGGVPVGSFLVVVVDCFFAFFFFFEFVIGRGNVEDDTGFTDDRLRIVIDTIRSVRRNDQNDVG